MKTFLLIVDVMIILGYGILLGKVISLWKPLAKTFGSYAYVVAIVLLLLARLLGLLSKLLL